MNILILMIPITMILTLSAVAAFIWATRTGQWDDLDLAPTKLMLNKKEGGQNNEPN